MAAYGAVFDKLNADPEWQAIVARAPEVATFSISLMNEMS